MSILSRFRGEALPVVTPTHAADRSSRPALRIVPRREIDLGVVLEQLRPPVVPSAQLGDPTPLFDAVMTDRWWRLPSAHPLFIWHHALASQLEVAAILDEFDDDELAEIRLEAVADVDFGWGAAA